MPVISTGLESSWEEPTAHLRWRDGVLEQQWAITTTRGGMVIGISPEWRPVPQAANGDNDDQS